MTLPPWATLVRADNPGPMTLDGTNTWLLRAPGQRGSLVVDPGPADEAHLAAVAAAAQGPADLVLLTHRHPDHAEGARRLAADLGAALAALDPTWCAGAEPLRDGQCIRAAGLEVTVLHTPGHSSDSVSFVVDDPAVPGVLTGDTVLGAGTTVIAHPDGRLVDYLASLERLAALDGLVLLPGHGPVHADAASLAGEYLAHRAERLAQVKAAVAAGATTPREVVEVVYAEVDRRLWPAAEASVRAQLDYLRETSWPSR